MASHLVEAAVKRAGGVVKWTPVLLGTLNTHKKEIIYINFNTNLFIFQLLLIGGLYKETKAPQGKDGSSMDVMAASKLAISTQGSVIICYFIFSCCYNDNFYCRVYYNFLCRFKASDVSLWFTG